MSRRSAMRRTQLGELVDDLLALEAGQPLQLQLEDLVGLDLAEREAGEQALLRDLRGARGADEGDHLVEVIEGDLEAFEDVGARLGLAQLVGGAPAHDVAAEVDEELAGVEDVQHPRPLVHDGEEDHPEGVLQLRVLVQVVEDDLGRLALLHVHDHPHALPVALVAHVGDAADALVAGEIRDLLDEPRLVDLVGDLGDDDRLAVVLAHLDLGARAHHHRSAAGAVGLQDPLAPHDEPGGREVRPVDAGDDTLEPLVGREVAVLEEEGDRVHDLAEVVRRDVRGHADRDAGRPVDEQVRQHRREHGGLDRAVVVGRLVVDGLLLDVLHHGGAEAGEPGLGVALGRRRVAVDRAEVALTVDEQPSHVERLRHAHQGVVDGLVAVGMVVPHHLADDLGALPGRAAGLQAHLLHAVEHPAVGGLQPVAHVGQRAADDHGHRVVHVGLAHLVRDVGGDAAVWCQVLFHQRSLRRRGCGRSRRCPR